MRRPIVSILITVLSTLFFCTAPAYGALISDGLSYKLLETPSISTETDEFTLHINNINSSSDKEGGRKGVLAFALTRPADFSSASAPEDFTLHSGGLSANGCNGHGNFFCFSALTAPTGILASDSSLTFTFSINATSLNDYTPDFKIYWSGTRRHYDLVSEPLSPTVSSTGSTGTSSAGVAGPSVYGMFVISILCLLLLRRYSGDKTRID